MTGKVVVTLLFTPARALLSAFPAANGQESWRNSVLKQRNSFETCWNRIENTVDQFRGVKIRRFIAFFLIQFEMDRESEHNLLRIWPRTQSLVTVGLVLLGVFCLDPLYLLTSLVRNWGNHNTLQKWDRFLDVNSFGKELPFWYVTLRIKPYGWLVL